MMGAMTAAAMMATVIKVVLQINNEWGHHQAISE
jgi:hypothetical protein